MDQCSLVGSIWEICKEAGEEYKACEYALEIPGMCFDGFLQLALVSQRTNPKFTATWYWRMYQDKWKIK